MKRSYYDRLKKFIEDEKIQSIIYKLSPTYKLYNNMKIKGNRNFNEHLANNTKLFFLSLSLFIVSMISIYDASNMKNKVYIGLYIVLCILPLFVSYNYFLASFEKIELNNEDLEKKDKKKYDRFKSLFSKKTVIIINITFILYCIFNMFGINGFENVRILKFLLMIITIYIFVLSRPIHFFSVFILDILKKLTKGDKRDINGKIRLVLLTIGSVVNIVLDYSILFYMLNTIGTELSGIKPMFNIEIKNIVDMVYFTAGFSDIEAANFITKIFVMIKDISIFILMTGNLAVYLNIEIKKPVKYEKVKER